MDRMKRPGVRVLTAILFLGLTVVGGAQERTSLPNTLGRVHLIYGSDPKFSTILRQRFPEIFASSHYDSIRATSVLVVNDVGLAIKAIALKWTVINQDGTETVTYTSLLQEPGHRNALPGGVTAISRNSVALISPLAHLEDESAVRSVEISHFNQQYSRTELTNAILSARKLSVRLDAVVFGNRVVIGPDTNGLAVMYQCERNGAIAEAKAVAGRSDDAGWLLSRLSSDALATQGATVECSSARSREASRMLELQSHQGNAALRSAVQKLAGASEIYLHRPGKP